MTDFSSRTGSKGGKRLYQGLALTALLSGLVGCSLLTPVPGDPPTRVFVVDNAAEPLPEMALLHAQAPAILSESDWAGWNRPGAIELSRDADGELSLRVDPTRPTLYAEMRQFTASSGKTYRNLIYRVHFERVPLRFKPFHITAGLNGGLFFVITLDDEDQPLLVTMVHSCGCYLAFLPTDRLDPQSLPAQWSTDQQLVFEETLPGMLRVPDNIDPGNRLMISLRTGTHRVTDVFYDNLLAATGNRDRLARSSTRLAPLASLADLPIGDGMAESAFDQQGYLRNAKKPLERMLMSWWALDWQIGVDKRLGRSRDDGQPFYTSLKYWDRNASDMRSFGDFLAYWDFKL